MLYQYLLFTQPAGKTVHASVTHHQVSQLAHRFDQEAQPAMKLKLSLEVVGGGGGSSWPISLGSNIETCRQLSSENKQLRHMLLALKSSSPGL